MKIKITCPFGADCEKPTDKGIERCAWYIEVSGKNPQTSAEIKDWGCAISWLPMIGLENNKHVLSGVAATEQVRNILAEMRGG